MINQTFEELRMTGKLPSPSGVGMQILRLTQGDDYSTEEIGQAISADSALTGRLLKLANSAESGSLEPITTVAEATVRLGIRTVRNVALGLSLVPSNGSNSCAAFDYERYWSLSLARAVAGQHLSSVMMRGVPAEMYILGLLSGVGALALASAHPEHYAEILMDPNLLGPEEVCRAESSRFEINHRDVAGCMLLDWGLPEEFARAVHDYEACEFRSSQKAIHTLTELLRAADVIARLCVANVDTPLQEWDQLSRDLAQLEIVSGFGSEHFRRTCNNAAEEWREWGEILGIQTTRQMDFELVEELAEKAREKARADEGAVPRIVRLDNSGLGQTASGLSQALNESSLRILTVDDDPVALKVLENHLVKAGHSVTTTTNGDEALRHALKECPQLVVADWKMPGLDGIELCRALRKISSGQKIYFLLLTGTNDDESVINAFNAGIDDYITKPFNPRILIARIHAGRRIITLQKEIEREKRKQQKQMMDLQVVTRKLRSAALADPLTELPNRRYAMKRLAQAWESSSRTSRPVSVVMMDIDHFKSVNDTFGHDAGDAVLKGAASILRSSCREDEDVCRIGGEEFVVICANTTAAQAKMAADRLRRDVENAPIFWQGHEHSVTMSFGVASRTPETQDYEGLLKAADEAVYFAKSSGRNRVEVAEINQDEFKKSA